MPSPFFLDYYMNGNFYTILLVNLIFFKTDLL